MTKVDQFESVFRHADKPVYHHQPLRIGKVLVVTDLERAAAEKFGADVRAFLSVLDEKPLADGAARPDWRGVHWRCVDKSEFQSVGELLELVNRYEPDLICSYRHLHSDSWKWPYSLGAFLDVLTQATEFPVVVLPHPESGLAHGHAVENTDVVMAVADHLAGDDRLVQFASGLVEKDGTLWLTHIEDEGAFDRTIEAIGKIPELDTETAREQLRKLYLGEPHDWVRSCREVLEKAAVPQKVEQIVTMGRRLDDYKRLISEHQVDLLVFHTKDADQLAMHGMAYPLAVELREIPLLML